jgi:hypothetical protein
MKYIPQLGDTLLYLSGGNLVEGKIVEIAPSDKRIKLSNKYQETWEDLDWMWIKEVISIKKE